jgi:pyruvyltransferase
MIESYGLYYWKLYVGEGNVGDELSPIIVKKINPNIKSVYETRYYNKFLGIGSIIHDANDGDIIWGSGIGYEKLGIKSDKLDIHMVRGPLTYEILKKTNNIRPIFGDPALLTSLYFPISVDKKYKVGIIPHCSNIIKCETYMNKNPIKNSIIISPTLHFVKFIELINMCEIIISNSLHGIILADSYNIPNGYFNFTPLPEGGFKFKDYMSSQNREFFNVSDINDVVKHTDIGKKIKNETILSSFPPMLRLS